MRTLSELRQWCQQCDMERAEYETWIRRRKDGHAYATEIWVQNVCLDCLRDKMASPEKLVWGMKYRALFTGNVWHEIGWSGSPS